MLTIKRIFINEVVFNYLAQNGFDGLMNEELKCSCHLAQSNNILGCEKLNCNCIPAYSEESPACFKMQSWKPMVSFENYPITEEVNNE